MSLVIKAQSPPLRFDEHGVCRVSGTRVTLETVIHRYTSGDSPEEIHGAFPSVPLVDVYATIAYYLAHRREVDAYLKQAKDETERTLREIRSRDPHPELKKRIRERRKAVVK